MAVLPDPIRAQIAREFMRDCTDPFVVVLQADIRAAVDALDDFFNTNAAAINNALPATARNNLTLPQKSLLVRYLIAARYG